MGFIHAFSSEVLPSTDIIFHLRPQKASAITEREDISPNKPDPIF